MPYTLLEAGVRDNREEQNRGFSIASGIVTNNCDLVAQGKIQVRIPSLNRTVWARMTSVGAGANRGFLFVPQPDDEVLLAFNQEDSNDACIIGGLWNNQDRTPELTPPEIMTKRTIRTGLAGGVGHEMTFDDAQQSVSIKTSTQQQVTIDPVKIELQNTAGTLKITMDNATQTVTIDGAAAVNVKSKGKISLDASLLELKGKVVNIAATALCSIQGKPIKLN